MMSALLAAVLLVCVAAATYDLGVAAVEPLDTNNEDTGQDDGGEGDFAPFMIVIEHADGWRCAGSLVSLRTALTSAWCARGRGAGPARELWALAASAAALSPASEGAVAARVHGARRVARVAVATGADAEVGDGSDSSSESWRGGAMDLALVELEEPFGSAARARPILMATAGGECGAPAVCHVSRALPRAATRRARLRVVSADLAPPERCSRAAPHWNLVRDRGLCLIGPKLCASDWGSGVVCGGKLCGVLSRSVRAADAGGGEADGADCGETHVAQSVSLWRRFLHCAHTLRACGRGGDCADLCVERQLVDEPEPPSPASSAPAAATPGAITDTNKAAATSLTTVAVFYYPTRTSKPMGMPPKPARSSPPRGGPRATFAPVAVRARTHTPMLSRGTADHAPVAEPTLASDHEHKPGATVDGSPSLRPSFEFEPNRADFKAAAAPSRSTRAYLKAGEYGDNAAEYGGEEPPPPAPTRTSGPASPPAASAGDTASTARASAEPPAAERRAAPARGSRAHAGSGASVPHPLAALLLLRFVYVFTAI